MKPTSLQGIAKRHRKDVECEASHFEEPHAVIPHARICEGAVGQPAVLPRCCKKEGKSLSFDWSSFGSAITGAIVGGLVAGYFALESVKRSFSNQRAQAEESEEKLIQGLLQAIHVEIETIYDRYQETMGSRLETLAEGDALNFYYPVVSDFFSVYNGSTFLIGRIPNNDLRKQIIKTYTLSKRSLKITTL